MYLEFGFDWSLTTLFVLSIIFPFEIYMIDLFTGRCKLQPKPFLCLYFLFMYTNSITDPQIYISWLKKLI